MRRRHRQPRTARRPGQLGPRYKTVLYGICTTLLKEETRIRVMREEEAALTRWTTLAYRSGVMALRPDPVSQGQDISGPPAPQPNPSHFLGLIDSASTYSCIPGVLSLPGPTSVRPSVRAGRFLVLISAPRD
ncbi:hypothetical protein RRG08_065933 [Elysia crispata]|uniref:Uncharacterized protein n=1 Tax=Elysia crispata TaxID=231223 RepID=A0AAE0ZFT5_9GAST|nr:hypothetical protein RRG08_065933 [Elysia crispata]